MADIYLAIESGVEYPNVDTSYNPSIHYPEYPFCDDDISKTNNLVYDMVRNSFAEMEYDKDNYGTAKWNPLGEFIKEGQVVLLKPNWVSHKNKATNSDPHLTCLITNPSLVRVVFDYVVIALKGSGHIIIADAPMQGTDLEKMFDYSGYNSLFAFVKDKHPNITISDLRKYRTKSRGGVSSEIIPIANPFGSNVVDLGKLSAHSENDKKNYSYKVSDYEADLTNKYHSNNSHKYEINSAALLADVVINLPKPKTHRLGGLTGAMKNIVGVTYEKASLPHRTQGDKETGRGDSYFKESCFKRWMEYCDDKQTYYSNKGDFKLSKIANFFNKAFYVMGRISSRDKYRIGSWYGNDTIWRTVADLNTILIYANKEGKICDSPQRILLNIGDMIVCGEKEGPVGPSPKHLKMVMITTNSVLFDLVLCRIMGFDENKIPSVKNMVKREQSVYESSILSNEKSITGIKVKEMTTPQHWHFEPHSCWKGFV